MKNIKIVLTLVILFSFSCKEEKKDTVEKNQSKVQQTKGEAIKLAAADFKSSIENKDVQLIDVRRPEEFTDGHLKNAKNINFYDDNFLSLMTEKLDKSKPVYLYCRSGGRSGKAAAQLSEQGYKVYDLKGGILDWKANNYPVETN